MGYEYPIEEKLEEVMKNNKQLEKENQQLKNTIDKAIKACDHYLSYATNEGFMESCISDIKTILSDSKIKGK